MPDPLFQRLRENWVRPALFFGNNPVSLAGGAITSASGAAMVGYWVIDIFRGGNINPYLGIIFFLILPALFIGGLVLIPLGIAIRRRKLIRQKMIPAIYPKVDLNDRTFRHGIDIVLVATIINLLIVSIASYRGTAYMDSPQFCGQSCHVMHPEYTAYKISPHSHVACVDCHIGTGAESFLAAKVNGTKQLIEVAFNSYPRPIPSPVHNLRSARVICEDCHSPSKLEGDKLLVRPSFADDEKNTETQTVVVLHVGGRDSQSRWVGIHGAHQRHIEYIATDSARAKVPWVQARNNDGTVTVYAVASLKPGEVPRGERRVMDCIDCHNRPAHTFTTAADAMNGAMAAGAISPSLPWVHKQGLALLTAAYASQEQAREQIPAALAEFYRANYPGVLANQAGLINRAGLELVKLYSENVFPNMKVTWGTYPNQIGHTSYPGCFRCHDGDHTSRGGQTITQDCSVCHNLLAVDEPRPKVLADLGIQP
ncbi:MAG TPA: NapC/NirT family cytochrome c [Terracidiphilus sp.]|nr:NapC/NirT family cytochrome c [Terracidiphilus sp.]